MYDNAPRMEQVTMIHLFGIKYSDEIKNAGIKAVVDAFWDSFHLQSRSRKV
jgi:diacylglycerol kinase